MTSFQIPFDTWTAARARAADQRETLRDVVLRALERELARPAKPRREQRAKRAAR